MDHPVCIVYVVFTEQIVDIESSLEKAGDDKPKWTVRWKVVVVDGVLIIDDHLHAGMENISRKISTSFNECFSEDFAPTFQRRLTGLMIVNDVSKTHVRFDVTGKQRAKVVENDK